MACETPQVTVLMAVHNGAKYVDQAVGSILNQTFTDFEFLIVDDGSSDDTPKCLASYNDQRVRIVRNPTNIGLTRSLNRGLQLARGALIARQDVDDVSHPERLRTQVEFLQHEPDVVVLGAQARYIDAAGRIKHAAPWPKPTSPLAVQWQLLFEGPFIHTSVMYRKAVVWDELNGYDESFATSQDFELWLRIRNRGHLMQNLPSTLVDFRIHDESVSTRYSLERVAKLRSIFTDALAGQLGAGAVPAGWPDTWIWMTYPGVLPESASPVDELMGAIDFIYARFVAIHPDASHDREIHRHIAATLIRLANHATQRYWMHSFVPFARACRLDPMMAVRASTRYIGKLTVGRWRRSSSLRTSNHPSAS
jgi:glycosyltransferase involved in cell wall biosynthesis